MLAEILQVTIFPSYERALSSNPYLEKQLEQLSLCLIHTTSCSDLLDAYVTFVMYFFYKQTKAFTFTFIGEGKSSRASWQEEGRTSKTA